MPQRPLAENSSSSATGSRRSRSRTLASTANRAASLWAMAIASASERITWAGLTLAERGDWAEAVMGRLRVLGECTRAFAGVVPEFKFVIYQNLNELLEKSF